MNKRFNRIQRNYMIIGLCAILLIMTVGYAAFSSQLRISGTSNISSSFLVKITNIEVSNVVGGAQDKEGVTTHTDDTATFGTTLQSPGDSITYDITIENQGTIDAVLKTINKTDASNSAIIFETSGVSEGDELLHGETATMKVTVTYNPNVTSQPSDLNSTLKVTLDYAQKGTEVVPGSNKILLGGQEVELVNSGDGLYADEYESGKYTYKGANPDNYIIFNNEEWRIIAKEADGTYKIIRNESVVDMAFDKTGGTYGSSNWDRPADIKTYLNETYFSTIVNNQDKIVPHTWSIGEVTWNNSNLAGQIVDENAVQSKKANVGLITASEYLRASNNKEQCGNININNANCENCLTTNWMAGIIPTNCYTWTLSPSPSARDEFTNVVYYYGDVGYGLSSGGDGVKDLCHGVSPVVYLSSDIILSGSGTLSNPYIITN